MELTLNLKKNNFHHTGFSEKSWSIQCVLKLKSDSPYRGDICLPIDFWWIFCFLSVSFYAILLFLLYAPLTD
jgi:hypothetical protein